MIREGIRKNFDGMHLAHDAEGEVLEVYGEAQIDEMGLRRKWNCLAQGFMVAVPGKGCTTTERILMLWCLTAAV